MDYVKHTTQQFAEGLRSDQLAPHSIEAEEAVLGSILINPLCLIEAIRFVKPDDFFIVRLAWILEAMIDLYERKDPLDYLTVVNEIDQRGRLAETGGASYLLSLINKTPSALNVAGYAQIVHRMAVRRQLIDHAQTSARLAHSYETDLDVILDEATKSLAAVTHAYTETVSSSTDIDDVMVEVAIEAAKWRNNPSLVHGYSTGIRQLDIATMGLNTDDYFLAAGRPSMGKSTLLFQIAWGLAEAGARVLVFSFEMNRKAVGRKMACQKAMINGMDLKKGKLSDEDFNRFMQATDDIARLKHRLIIDSRRGIPVETMKVIADGHRYDGGLDFVIVDTVNRVKAYGKNRYECMTTVSQSLADWSDDNIGIIASAQLRRSETVKIPEMQDLKESGSFEQDADQIVAVHRPYYYTRLAADRHLADLYHLKDRDGEAGHHIPMYWSDAPGFAPLETTSVDLDNRTAIKTPNYDNDGYVLGRDND